MKRLLALALASLLCAASATVLGLGLGEIRLHSALNQALDAEIELLDVSPDELDGLVVRLASDELFDRYGIDRPALLADLTFEVARRSDGSAFVRVKSQQPLREPFLTLLVEARWGRGRLLREYTMLVDPPAFMAEERPVVPAPAVEEPTYAPTVQPAEPVSSPAPSQVAVPSAPESQPEYSAPEAVSPQVAAPSSPGYQPDASAPSGDTLGGDYGPVKRNETLWGIASRLRPDDAISVNQMMLAIFRANPDAFRGNINRLNSGAILRIPDLETVRALSAREAFLEAKRQNDEWRPSFVSTPTPAPSDTYREPEPVREPVREPAPTPVKPVVPEPTPVTPPKSEPSLTVVAPSDDEEPVSDPGARVAQLERQLEAAKASKGKKGRERVARLERELEEAKRLIQVPSQTLSEIQDQAATTPSLAETPQQAETPTPAETAPAETTPTPTPEVVQRAPRKPEKGLLDTVLDNLANPVVLGGLVLLLLIPVVLVGGKRLKPRLAALAAARKARAEAAAAAKAAAQAAAAQSYTETGDDDSDKTVAATQTGASEEKTVMDFGDFAEPAKPAAPAPAAGGFAGLFGGGDGRTGETMVESDVKGAVESAASEKTQIVPRPQSEMEKTVMQTVAAPIQPSAPASAPAAKPSHEDTVIGGTPMKLDENDPLSEADFHMAYGLYDQAADLLKKASQRDPSRRDIKLKLLETYFASGNKGAFVEAARSLRAEMGARPDADWNSVLIFGKQMAPEEALFSEQASAGAADLDFGAAGTGTETAIDLAFDAPMDAAPGASAAPAADSMLDFDITGAGAAPAAPEAPAPAADAGGLEFDLGDFKLDTESVTAAPAAKAAPKVGSGEVKDTDTQSDFDKALAELSAFVDTNLPAEEAGGQAAGGEFNLDSLDLGDDAGLGGVELDMGGDDGNEIDTKLDLARAYIDMGDPDGARNILEEVVSDGNAQQKADAQKLLAQIK